MIKRQARERLAHVLAALDHGNLFGAKVPGQQLHQQGGGARCHFRGFQHDPVASGVGAHQRRQGQKYRIVPGRDDPHHAQRLGHQFGPRRLEGQIQGPGPGAHPTAEVFPGMADTGQRGEYFPQQGFLPRPAAKIPAEIFVNGRNNGIPVGPDHGADATQAITAQDPVRGALGQIGGLLGRQLRRQSVRQLAGKFPTPRKARAGCYFGVAHGHLSSNQLLFITYFICLARPPCLF